jgi:hypothetical protein
MFARQVSIHLKSNALAAFAETVEREGLPLLRKHPGFQDEITLVSGRDAVALSLWDTKENAEAYNRSGYAEMLKVLSTVTDGTPQLRTFEVANSTFHKIAAMVAV